MNVSDILEKYNFWGDQEVIYGYPREHYLQYIVSYIDNALIKVLMGQRRAGKSYLLRSVIHHLINERGVSKENILYINMDIHAFHFIHTASELMNVIEVYKQYKRPTGKIFLFLDEVQEIEGWEKALNSLSQDYVDQYELFVSGSNANMLAGELGTYLSGRYVPFTVYPFSYQEFLEISSKPRNKQTFVEYLQLGGMPELYQFETQKMRRDYIVTLRDSIVLRDVIHRHQIRDVVLLEKLIDFLSDAIGSYFSVNSMVNTLKSKGFKANHETISAYLHYLEQAFYVHRCDRFDIRGKRRLAGETKYYLNDLAFRFYLNSSYDYGFNRILENVVFLDLKRRGYTVHAGQLQTKSIDFIAEKGQDKIYVQVAYLLTDEDVIQREFGNLALITDHHPKYVVTLDDLNLGHIKGIQHQQAWTFVGSEGSGFNT